MQEGRGVAFSRLASHLSPFWAMPRVFVEVNLRRMMSPSFIVGIHCFEQSR